MKSVLVLMSTYNGEKYIEQQIESLLLQENVDINILIRDDGSTDNTVSIIRGIGKDKYIEIIEGCNVGYAKSFMILVNMAKKHKADYYAFCDQDDYWESQKLSIAIKSIENDDNNPALYLSQAKIVDGDLKPVNTSFHSRIVDLGSVLEHNYAIGCTMVFNEMLRELLDIDTDDMNLAAGHDSWVFLVALAVGANVYFDLNGYVLYRQHGNNASGKIVSIKQAARAINKILFKWKHMRSDSALKLLNAYNELISIEDRKLLIEASSASRNMKEKLHFMKNNRMNSDYPMVDILFKIAVLFDLF